MPCRFKVCQLRGHFDVAQAHDGARFAKYLGEVKAGTKKINASVLKPHHLVREAMGNAACVLDPEATERVNMGLGAVRAPWMEGEQMTSALCQTTMELLDALAFYRDLG